VCGVLVKTLPHKQKVQGSNPHGTLCLCGGVAKVARHVGRWPRWLLSWPVQLEKKLKIFIDQINKKINIFLLNKYPNQLFQINKNN